MSLVKTVSLQWANFLLCFFSLIIEMTVTGIVVGIFLLLFPVPPPKATHRIWECPTRLIPSWQSLELKPPQWGLVVCKDVYFLPGKMIKKETSCFFTRMIYLVLQERKCPQEHAPLEAPHSCKVTVFSSTDYYINQTTMKYHKTGFLLYFSHYMGLFNKTNLSTALFNFFSRNRWKVYLWQTGMHCIRSLHLL